MKFFCDEMTPRVRVMIGMDCDRPRGEFIATKEGSDMAERKINSIEKISSQLHKLDLPRTFSICGSFLESMSLKFGKERMNNAFSVKDDNVEIADHSYSHNIVKPIKNRPDKIPLTPNQVIEEYHKNTKIFKELLGLDIPNRGYRTPLGHYEGLSNLDLLQDELLKSGILYVSSDLRGPNDSLYAPLVNANNVARQPYTYENGLLEIPSMGWQDVVFSQPDYISKFEKLPEDLPNNIDGIRDYTYNMISNANSIVLNKNRDFFFGLCLHPYDTSFYDIEQKFFVYLKDIVNEFEGSFCTYKKVSEYYNQEGSKLLA